MTAGARLLMVAKSPDEVLFAPDRDDEASSAVIAELRLTRQEWKRSGYPGAIVVQVSPSREEV